MPSPKRVVSRAVEIVSEWTARPEKEVVQIGKRLVTAGLLPKASGRRVPEIDEHGLGLVMLTTMATETVMHSATSATTYADLPLLSYGKHTLDSALDLFRFPFSAPESERDDDWQQVYEAVERGEIKVFRNVPRVILAYPDGEIEWRQGTTEIKGPRADVICHLKGRYLIQAHLDFFGEEAGVDYGWTGASDPRGETVSTGFRRADGSVVESDAISRDAWNAMSAAERRAWEQEQREKLGVSQDADAPRPPKAEEIPITATLADGSEVELERYPRKAWEAMSPQQQDQVRSALMRKKGAK